MYRMKQLICKRITEVKSVALCLFLLSLLFSVKANAQITSYTDAESFLFSFKEGNDMFLADYGDNAYQLKRLGERLPVANKYLLNRSYHLLIVAHVGAYNYGENEVVNEAALRAGRIRAYMRRRLAIPHECVAFYVDRSGNYRDQVHVYLVKSPLPWFANIEISYSESRYPMAIDEAIRKYGNVPYVNLYPHGFMKGAEREVYVIDDPLFDRSELEDYRLASVVDTQMSEKTRDMSVANQPAAEGATPVPSRENTAVVPGSQPSVSRTAATSVYMSVKTNLLPWFTVAPSVQLGTNDRKWQTGSFMPNLEVECYFADRWSVVVAGLYSDFSYKEKARDRWSVSEFSVEPRVWPLTPGKFTWLNTGLFVEYGDFDVRGSAIDPDPDVLYGKTGRYWTMGASIGCLVPWGEGFCSEVSVRTGYRSVYGGKKYRYDKIDSKNYLESRFSSTGFMIGLKVSLMYRFRIR